MVAGFVYGGGWCGWVRLCLLRGCLEVYCRSRCGCLEGGVEPRCVWVWNLEGSGGFRWVLGSNFHFWWVLCRVGIWVGGDLRKMFWFGSGLNLVGFRVLGILVKVFGRQWATLFEMGGLACVMCSSRVCLVCIGGWRFLVRMSRVLSCVATPPILISPLM